MMRTLFYLTTLLLILTSCNTQKFKPGVYENIGIESSLVDHDDYTSGFFLLSERNLENEHLTFDFGDVLFDVAQAGERIIDGSWTFHNHSKTQILLNYNYDDLFYSEVFEITFPTETNANYKLTHVDETKNAFSVNLEYFESLD